MKNKKILIIALILIIVIVGGVIIKIQIPKIQLNKSIKYLKNEDCTF